MIITVLDEYGREVYGFDHAVYFKLRGNWLEVESKQEDTLRLKDETVELDKGFVLEVEQKELE